MKPRLKLHLNGSVTIVSPMPSGWSAFAADAFIKKHYGSRMAFCIRFGLSYGHMCEALRDDTFHRVQRAGATSDIRQLLGLKSEPSEQSARQSAAYYRGRGIPEPRRLGVPK